MSPAKKDQDLTNERQDIELIDGAAVAAQILRHMPAADRSRLVSEIATKAPTLAVKLQDKMYDFEDIRTLSPQGIQTLVQEINHNDLVLAFTEASQQLREKITENITDRKKLMLQDDLSNLGACQPQEVKEAQWRILRRLDELRSRGMIRTEGKGVWV